MISQTDIFNFSSIQPSATTDKYYIVVWDEEKKRHVCKNENGGPGCKHEQERGEKTKQLEPCRHILKHRNDELRRRVSYLESRAEWKSDDAFESFEQVMERVRISKSFEISYICNIALALAYTNEKYEVCSDWVYMALDGKFEKQGVMGIAFKLMKDKGLLDFLYYKKSETPTNHGAVVGQYRLTDMGKGLFRGGVDDRY